MWAFLLAFLLAVIVGSGLTLFTTTWIMLTMLNSSEKADEEELRKRLSAILVVNTKSPLMDELIEAIQPKGRDE